MNEQGVALQGYDPVTYELEKSPRTGDRQWSYSWKGGLWHFATAANRDRFKEAPSRYLPIGGGYCAMSVLQGELESGSPQIYEIWQGKVFLFASQESKAQFMLNKAENIQGLALAWPKRQSESLASLQER